MPPRLQVLPLTLGVVLLLGGCSGTSSPRSATPSSTKPASSPPVTASAPAPTQPPATSSPAALPAGFEPFSVSAVSASTGVVLGVQRGCGSGTCTRLLRTTDGFKTFTPVTPPPAPVVQGDPASIGISPGVNGAVSDIRLDAEGNEWAYGEVLWTKHGGGRWTKVPNVIDVLDLEVSGGKAIALVCESVANQCGMGSSNLMRSPVNEDRFRDVGPSAENGGPGESLLAVSGQHVALLRPDTAGGGKRLLYLSDDGATTFRSREQELSITSDVAIALTPTGTFCLFQHTPGEERGPLLLPDRY